jgi:hypothetical protein
MTRACSSAASSLLLAGAILVAHPTQAAFHLAHIAEVNARAGDDPGDQYVEIEMELAGQTLTKNSVLGAFDCSGTYLGDLLIVPDNIANGGAGVRWIMATQNGTGGIVPDFLIPNGAPAIPADCGQVCWGAPGIVPPVDTGWSRTNLNNFVDCVSWGPYTGPTRTGSGAPSPFTPGDGTYSLERVNDTTLTPACPSPENNDGTVGSYGFCPEPTTTSTIFGTSTSTTTVASTSTTTSTTPPPTDERLGGGLTLSTKVEKPAKSKLKLRTIDQLGFDKLTLGRGPGSADDPTIHGGRLLVFSSAAGAFLNEYALDTTTGGWVPKRKRGEQVGYVFKGNGAIKKVTITDGKFLTAKGKGEALELQLGAEDPSPVGVILEIGEHRYCLQFTHALEFKPNKRYYAPKNMAPAACPTVPD